MTYRVVQDQPCTDGPSRCLVVSEPCLGCRGDGTRMVEVAVVEPQQVKRVEWDSGNPVKVPERRWVEVEP